jgi:chromosome partitioning protein
MSAPPEAAPAVTPVSGQVPAAYGGPVAAARVVVVFNQKGGLGKTTIVLGLAAQAALAGWRVLVVDVDPQGTAYALSMRIPEDQRPYTVVHELDPDNLARLRELGEWDRIYVDCPGSLQDHGVLRRVLEAADYAFILYDHKIASEEPTFRTVAYATDAATPYRVLLNKLDPRMSTARILDAWDLLDSADYEVDWPGGEIRHARDGDQEPAEGTVRTTRVTRIPSCRLFFRAYEAWNGAQEAGVPITSYRGGMAVNVRADLAAVFREVERDLRELAGK